MTMQGWAGDCIALLNHPGIASAHVAGHSFGAGIALQMAIDAPRQSAGAGIAGTAAPVVGAIRRQFTEWMTSAVDMVDACFIPASGVPSSKITSPCH
jgi:pimeloyl-ACP methyl ester carboxylesterase